MAQNSKIEWTDATWSPVVGCKKISPGCAECYAVMDARRLGGNPNPKINSIYSDLVQVETNGRLNWTGVVKNLPARLDAPRHWKKPLHIFVCSQSDLFHDDVPFSFIEQVWQTMYDTPQHTYQILTKRPERMLEFIASSAYLSNAPLENVYLGVSAENQSLFNQRWEILRETPAALRFLSLEPMLEWINISKALIPPLYKSFDDRVGIDWVICGGESSKFGPNARPMHPDWPMLVMKLCRDASVPFLFKQWGDWMPICSVYADDQIEQVDQWSGFDMVALQHDGDTPHREYQDGTWYVDYQPDPTAWWMVRVGKKAAGRKLFDGRTFDEFPRRGDVNVCS